MLVSAATEQFLADLNRSPNTVQTYGTALNHLCSMCGDRDVSEVRGDIVPEYVRFLRDNNPVSVNTMNLYLVALTRFYEWLVLSGLTEQDILTFRNWVREKRQPKPRRAPKVPPEDDVQKLLDRIRGSRPTPVRPETQAGRDMILSWLRDRAIIETLRSTGCRVGELVKLLVSDVAGGSATVYGKRSKERTIFWDDDGWMALTEYLETKDARSEDPVFSRHDWKAGQDTSLSTKAIRSILAEWCRKAHVKVITPHQFRHRFGTLSLRSMKLDEVQDLMGHESPNTTRIYTQHNSDELRAAHSRAKY